MNNHTGDQGSHKTTQQLLLQSSQVDLLAKSEMLDGVAVIFDAEGVTPLEGSGGTLPKKILKK